MNIIRNLFFDISIESWPEEDIAIYGTSLEISLCIFMQRCHSRTFAHKPIFFLLWFKINDDTVQSKQCITKYLKSWIWKIYSELSRFLNFSHFLYIYSDRYFSEYKILGILNWIIFKNCVTYLSSLISSLTVQSFGVLKYPSIWFLYTQDMFLMRNFCSQWQSYTIRAI